jgi:hypothetical protein
MKRKGLVVGIILLFIGVAIAPSIHFTTVNVNASINNIQEERITQKELLFQTILDVANNREIQKIVYDSEIQSNGFFTSQVITKNYLNTAFRIGLILTKIFGVNRIHSMIQRYQINIPEVQKEISDVIEGNLTLKMEMDKLLSVSCGCDNENTTTWTFPVLCTLLVPLFIFTLIIFVVSGNQIYMPVLIMATIGSILHCWWHG